MIQKNLITLTSTVPNQYAGKSLLEYLVERYPYKKLEVWQAEIMAGKFTVNDSFRIDRVLKKDDRVCYTTQHQEPWVNKLVSIIYEDDDFLFVNKPAPLPSHAQGSFIKNNLINLVREERPDLTLFLGHRLDMETSGVMVLAKSKKILSVLMPMFERGDIKKKYVAIVQGVPDKDEFIVSGGMAKDPDSQVSIRWRLFPEATPNTKSSCTHFKVLQRLNRCAVLECVPLTGRTSQIRVHLDSMGLPLLGDKLYGKRDDEFLYFLKQVKFVTELPYSPHCLHASSLEFHHPVTGALLSVEADLPQAFEIALKNFQA